MMTSLSGRTALVTGASRGVGRHTARVLGAAGMNVVLCARTDADLHAVADEVRSAGGRALIHRLDVRDRAAFTACLDRTREAFGGLDVLVCNAGLSPYKALDTWTAEEIDEVLDVNLRAVVHQCHAALPDLLRASARETGRGHVVIVASDVGRRAVPNMGPYVAAKHGVVGFAGSLLREVKGRGVRVTTVLPGVVDTHFGGGAEGTRDETWALRPAHVAGTIVWALQQPPHVVLDEITVHPMQQDF